MKVGVVGSRGIEIEDFSKYLPDECDTIVSGGAKGIDTSAERYADRTGLKKLIFKPEYEKYGRRAPLVRNITIIENSDEIIAFWDGESRGTKYTIDHARQMGKKVTVFVRKKGG